MAIKAVHRYQSEDGQLHEDITVARKHDAQYRLLTGVKTLLGNAGNDTSPSTTHISIVNKPEIAMKLRDELNKVLEYHRTYTGKVARKVVPKR